MRVVFCFLEQMIVNGFGESGPSATRVELVGRVEYRFARCHIDVNTFAKLIVVFVIERLFGGRSLRHLILYRRETRP